jgi:RNA polymerase sigma-70 factor (ECF subfamily)
LQRRGAEADAEDLLQETFLRAYANLPLYRENWRLAAWLFTIARRVSINHHRRPRAQAAPGDDWSDSIADRVPGPAESLAEEEGRRGLWDLAARILSEGEFTAVWLFYVEELSAREIAAVLDRSWAAVKTMLFRARRRLKPFVENPDPRERTGRASVPHERRQSLRPSSVEVRHV